MTRIAYICGPITAANAYEQEQNVRRAEAVYVALCKAGIPAICPHLHGRFLDGVVSHAEWLELDMPLLERCTDLVLVAGWQKSAGSQQELVHAEKRGLQVWLGVTDFLRDARKGAK